MWTVNVYNSFIWFFTFLVLLYNKPKTNKTSVLSNIRITFFLFSSAKEIYFSFEKQTTLVTPSRVKITSKNRIDLSLFFSCIYVICLTHARSSSHASSLNTIIIRIQPKIFLTNKKIKRRRKDRMANFRRYFFSSSNFFLNKKKRKKLVCFICFFLIRHCL